MVKVIHSAVMAAALVPAALCTGQATAQSQASQAEPMGTADIVVTAQRREQRINDIGMSVSALSSDELAARGINTVADLARAVPGFSFTQSDVNVPVYTLRGVGYNETSLAASPAVSVYVDEVALPYPAMTAGPQFDLERVEVVKGPQGTLYGQNSTGGAINYVARKPGDRLEFGGSLGFGRFNRFTGESYVSTPLTPSLGIRVAVKAETGDPWQRSLTRDDRLGRISRLGGRLLFDWQATPGAKFALVVNGWRDKGDTLAPQLIAVVPQTPARALPAVLASPLAPTDALLADWDPGRDFSRDDRFYQIALRGDIDVGELATLTSITAYSDLKTDSVNERDGMASQNSFYRAFGYARSLSQELRLAGKIDGLVQWIIGGNVSRGRTFDEQDISVQTSSNTQSVFGVYSPFTNNDSRQKSTSWAIFGNGDWTLTDGLTLTTGLRYTQSRRSFNGCTFDVGDGRTAAAFANISAFFRGQQGLAPLPSGTFKAGQCVTLTAGTFAPTDVDRKLNQDNLSWRVALDWKLNRDTLIYASASQGYKSGNFPTLSASSIVQYTPVVQERLLAYEAGIKASLIDRTLQANVALFYYDYNNKQLKGRIADAVFGSLQALVNIPKSHVQGGEIELIARPAKGLTFVASYAYTQSKIDRYSGYTPFNVLTDFAGQAFNFSPKHMVNVDIEYRWALTEHLRGSFGGSISDRSATTAAVGDANLFEINSYALADLRVGIGAPDDRWKITATIQNLTNTYYWSNVVRGNDSIARFPGQPRTYSMTATWRLP